MSRKTCLQLFFLPLLCLSQARIWPLYGFNVNNGIEHVVNKLSGLKWLVKPNPRKKSDIELGTETSWIERRSIIKITSGYNNSVPELHKLNFSVLRVYLGITFGKG